MVSIQADHDVAGLCSVDFDVDQERVCTDLNIITPNSGVYDPAVFPVNISVVMFDDQGGTWVSDVTYDSTDNNATFDGNEDPHTTSDLTVSYDSSSEATVTVSAVDDPNNVCFDSFTYSFPDTEVECAYLNIVRPSGGAIDPADLPLDVEVEMVGTDGNPWISDVIYESTDSNATFDGQTEPLTTPNLIVEYDSNNEARVTATAANDPSCRDSFDYVFLGDDDDDDDDDDDQGDFTKYIFTFNFEYEKGPESDEQIFFSHDQDYVFYTLEYDPVSNEDTVFFTDEMWETDLRGHLGDGTDSGGSVILNSFLDPAEEAQLGTHRYTSIQSLGLTEDNEIGSSGIGNIVRSEGLEWVPYLKRYDAQSDASDFKLVEACSYTPEGALINTTVCYDPATSPETGEVIIENAGTIGADWVIRIRYVGRVDSALNCDSTEDECLTEQFINTATATNRDGDEVEAQATLVVLCSYLVTRGGADVYLEVEINQGSDLSCIFVEDGEEFANTDALVILEAPGGSDDDDDSSPQVQTGDDGFTSVNLGLIFDTSDRSALCENDDYQNNLIGNISSFVCEVVIEVSDIWSREVVEATQESQVSLSTRNVRTLQDTSRSNPSFSSWSDLRGTLYNLDNPNSNILYYEGDGDTITLNRMELDEGQYTLIVKNANLRFNGDFSYGNKDPLNNPASMAFIVQDGDIYIGHNARVLNGIFYTDQKFDGDERDAVDEPLTFIGAVAGAIDTLLDKANYVGPGTLDGAGITVRFDSTLLFATPPATSEFIQLEEGKTIY